MRIPEIRSRLEELAAERNMPELEFLASELKRRPPVRKAPKASRRISVELGDAVRAYAGAFPDAAQSTIAGIFGVNPGRVSEWLAGKRQ